MKLIINIFKSDRRFALILIEHTLSYIACSLRAPLFELLTQIGIVGIKKIIRMLEPNQDRIMHLMNRIISLIELLSKLIHPYLRLVSQKQLLIE